MEAAINSCNADEVFLIFLAKFLENTSERVQLQPTACIYIKNKLFRGYFIQHFAKTFSTFL